MRRGSEGLRRTRIGVVVKSRMSCVRAPGGLRPSLGVTLSMAVALALLAGCSKGTSPQTEPTSFDEIVKTAIAEAEAGGASEAQLALLSQAQLEGEISLETARAATRAGVECITAAGSYALYSEEARGSGLVIPGFSYASDTTEQQAIGDACERKENFWVVQVYATQPSSKAVNDAYLEQQVPVVRSCLEREGYTVPSDATTLEVLNKAADVLSDTKGALNCLYEARIDGF